MRHVFIIFQAVWLKSNLHENIVKSRHVLIQRVLSYAGYKNQSKVYNYQFVIMGILK